MLIKEVEYPLNGNSGEPRYLDVVLAPLQNGDNGPYGISISFYDVSGHKRMQAQIE